MRRIIRSAAAVWLAALLLSVAGCGGTADSDRQAARINDTVITEANLNTYTVLSMYRDGYDPSEADVDQRKKCLEEMVDAEVIRQYYEKNDLEIYDDAYNAGKDSFLSDMQTNDAEFLDQNDITYEDLVYYYRAQYATGRFFEETSAQYDETGIMEEARRYYDEHRDDYAVEKQKRVSVILTKKKKQAAEVTERLIQGTDFAEAAKEYSIDENSAVNGGDLGFFTRNEMKDRFGKGIFSMQVGEFNQEPVKTADGYAVILITDSHDSGYQSFEEVSQNIVYLLYENYNAERIESIKDEMEVEVS